MSVTNENDSGDSRKMVGGLCPGVNNSVYQIYIYIYVLQINDNDENGNN